MPAPSSPSARWALAPSPAPDTGITDEELSLDFFTRALREGRADDRVEVVAARPFPLPENDSILSQLVMGHGRRRVGLMPFELAWVRGAARGTTRVLVKSKADDREIIGVMNGIARACGEPIASLHEMHRFETGFRNCHLRELAFGELRDPAFRAIAARTYATWRRDGSAGNRARAYVLVTEYLDDVTHLNTAMHPEAWAPAHVRTVLHEMARFHAAFLGRTEPLVAPLHLEPATTAQAVRLAPLWDAIAAHNAAWLPGIYTAPRVAKLRRAIASLETLWSRLEDAPRTLVHNDLSTRNLCLGSPRSGHALRVYDWELATVHVPQRDVCELLAYVLAPDAPNVVRLDYVEGYRRELEAASGRRFPRSDFHDVYALAAIDFAIGRLGLTAVAHRFQRYAFLPRVLETHFRYLDSITVDPSGDTRC